MSVAITQWTAWKQTLFVFTNWYPIQQSQSHPWQMCETSTYNFIVYISITPQNNWKYQLTVISELHLKCWSENIHRITTAPDPLLSLTSDHCSALGWGWGCHSKTTGETVPALGAAPLFSPREWPRPCAHVVISLMATGTHIIRTTWPHHMHRQQVRDGK